MLPPARPARPPAREVVLILNGYDLSGRGRNDLFCWNGIAGFYDRYPIRVKVGELVRIYVVNMVEFDPIASFHLHAQTFDVYRTGTRMTPDEHTDIVTLGQTERAILEVRFERKGRYMFHPHQSYMAAKGAMAPGVRECSPPMTSGKRPSSTIRSTRSDSWWSAASMGWAMVGATSVATP